MNFQSMVFEPQFGVKKGPVNQGALKPMSFFLEYNNSMPSAKPLSAQPYHNTKQSPNVFAHNPHGMTVDKPHISCYRDVKLTKKQAPSWNIFSWMDNSDHYKGFQVAPRIIRERQP